MKYMIALGVAVALVGGGVVALVYFTGPRMWVQPNVRPFQAPAPPLPEGVVPMRTAPALPTEQEAAGLASAVPVTKDTVAAGAVYYEYYCVFCHGQYGDGNGPVGESYAPKPADLREQKYAAYSDGQLLRGMLLGTGHEPVLERVVLPEHRWPLVHYTRGFTK
jgi:mono/diheme cytochrome c family protein